MSEMSNYSSNNTNSWINLTFKSERVRNTIDAWLKFGTVFFIYRLCTYFFFDREKPDAKFFEGDSLKLVLFILLGFTVYFLFIHPYIPINSQHPVLRNLGNDMLMFGTVLITSHLLESWASGGKVFNKDWLKVAGIILLSFATYDIVVAPFIPYDGMKPSIAPIVRDWAKYGTFLIVFRLLMGGSLLNKEWILSVLFVLLGFTGYQLITKKIIGVHA